MDALMNTNAILEDNKTEVANKMAEQIIVVAKELIGLLVLEKNLILSQKIYDIEKTAERKNVLISAYQAGLQAFNNDVDLLNNINSNSKIELKAVLSLLQKTMQSTMDTVEAARNARTMMLESIREAALHNKKPQTYSGNRVIIPDKASLSISFNESI